MAKESAAGGSGSDFVMFMNAFNSEIRFSKMSAVNRFRDKAQNIQQVTQAVNERNEVEHNFLSSEIFLAHESMVIPDKKSMAEVKRSLNILKQKARAIQYSFLELLEQISCSILRTSKQVRLEKQCADLKARVRQLEADNQS